MDIFVRNSPAFFVAFDAVTDGAAAGITTRIYQTNVNATTGQGPFVSGLVTRFDLLQPADDWYAVSATAGQTLRLETFTPAGGPGEFVNNLNPSIQLLDPAVRPSRPASRGSTAATRRSLTWRPRPGPTGCG